MAGAEARGDRRGVGAAADAATDPGERIRSLTTHCKVRTMCKDIIKEEVATERLLLVVASEIKRTNNFNCTAYTGNRQDSRHLHLCPREKRFPAPGCLSPGRAVLRAQQRLPGSWSSRGERSAPFLCRACLTYTHHLNKGTS